MIINLYKHTKKACGLFFVCVCLQTTPSLGQDTLALKKDGINVVIHKDGCYNKRVVKKIPQALCCESPNQEQQCCGQQSNTNPQPIQTSNDERNLNQNETSVASEQNETIQPSNQDESGHVASSHVGPKQPANTMNQKRQWALPIRFDEQREEQIMKNKEAQDDYLHEEEGNMISLKKNLISSSRLNILRPYLGISYPLLGFTGGPQDAFASGPDIMYPGRVEDTDFGQREQINIFVNFGIHLGMKFHEYAFAEFHFANFAIRDQYQPAATFLPEKDYLSNGSMFFWSASFGLYPISITLNDISIKLGGKAGFSVSSWLSLASKDIPGVENFEFDGPTKFFPVFGARLEVDFFYQAFVFADFSFIFPGMGQNSSDSIPEGFTTSVLSVGFAWYFR